MADAAAIIAALGGNRTTGCAAVRRTMTEHPACMSLRKTAEFCGSVSQAARNSKFTMRSSTADSPAWKASPAFNRNREVYALHEKKG